MNVVSLFDRTGTMLQPWQQAGYTTWAVDIQHSPGITATDGGRRWVGHDLHRPWLPPFDRDSIAFVAAFPPCTHLAVSGARWFKGKGLRALAEAIDLFATAAEFAEWSGAPYLIENPVSTISTYWRKPDHIFNPSDYTLFEPADNYTKKTCLWTGGGFTMPTNARDETLGPPDPTLIHHMPPSAERADMRSMTPLGFARAVYEANTR